MGETIRVAILAPNLAIRVGLRTLLGGDEAVELLAESGDFSGLADRLEAVDVMVLQGQNPFEAWLPSLREESQVAILWVTDDPQAAQTLRGLPSRAWGIVSTDASEDELFAALFAVDAGLIVAPPQVLEPLWPDPSLSDAGAPVESLTPRETEVLQSLALGLANKQIALELAISEHTVKFHISSIYGKLGVTNRTEAVRQGLRLGLIGL